MQVCQHCLVSGKVQGVWYRRAAAEAAKRLNVQGWVRNLRSGDVEVLACGDENNVTAFCEWLWTGSKKSDVKRVVCHELVWEDHLDFSIR